MAGAQAQPKWTFSIFMIVLATSLPFVVTGVDPLLLSLNLPAIRQDLGIPSDLVDPEEELIGILMTQHVWDSPGAPGVLLPLTFEKASSIGL